jgi:hypothetical protein
MNLLLNAAVENHRRGMVYGGTNSEEFSLTVCGFPDVPGLILTLGLLAAHLYRIPWRNLS